MSRKNSGLPLGAVQNTFSGEMGGLGIGYTIRRIGRRSPFSHDLIRKYHVEEAVFDWTCDLATLAPRCTEPSAIAKACGFAAASNDKQNKVECAVYVIAVEGLPVSKIGISSCPTQRLAELQAAHWSDLSLHAVIWFPTRKSETVEQSALKAAAEMDCRLRGEWVALDANEALELVLKAGRFHDVAACDSAVWMGNWKRRVDALRVARTEQNAFMRATNPANAMQR